jgi:hypothetical protein
LLPSEVFALAGGDQEAGCEVALAPMLDLHRGDDGVPVADPGQE